MHHVYKRSPELQSIRIYPKEKYNGRGHGSQGVCRRGTEARANHNTCQSGRQGSFRRRLVAGHT